MAKPDNRADNVEHLQKAVQNTLQNLHEGEDYLAEHADEIGSTEFNQIRSKNERRREAIQGFRSEIKDEAHKND
ncbi:small acid-soluble spore protein Tlp [Paenibacillus sambharensis]|uniref:Small acid-soluble spore protein Tlp n=1 Tax=Paenibacillus sambharensis TaxID=1803190 RepID=A0A2W1LF34_9BACL|nr:small acid-soluble spore protein Tlp [Paenibacillus sambharensis]PZD93655.1 small acid-soluble spore protein Tlp [Paenibacillus sambharensis]